MSNSASSHRDSHDGNKSDDGKKEGKIFVGGLTWDTTVDDLKDYFNKYGHVRDANIIKDINTGRSRGFGFVVFDDEEAVGKVFATSNHILNGKKVDTKNAFRRNSEPSCKKIFVGGVDPNCPESAIREYFSQFGEIEDIDFPWDKERSQRRAFCFIAFQSSEIVDKILKQPKHKLGDRMVDVKKATPKVDYQLGLGNPALALSILSQALNFGCNFYPAFTGCPIRLPQSSQSTDDSRLGFGYGTSPTGFPSPISSFPQPNPFAGYPPYYDLAAWNMYSNFASQNQGQGTHGKALKPGSTGHRNIFHPYSR